MITQLQRETKFMWRQRYLLMLLLCSFVVSAFSVATGVLEVEKQRNTIERLLQADQVDRAEAQAKYDDAGSLAYYTFHLSYSEPTNLAFAALGERDVYPWKHRIRMLALEGQIYESDAQNAELAQAGKIDFAFVLAALSPLFIILLFHDLKASERSAGRHDFLVSNAQSSFALWGARVIVRLVAVFVALMLPFYVGALISNTALIDVFWISLSALVYLIFWTAISLFFGNKSNSAPRVASALIGLWALFAFIIPILGDLSINHSIHAPKGGDILMTQREAVNDAWDLPQKVTMDAFVQTHPEYADKTDLGAEGFAWNWYYAFQQVGDQTAASLSQEYREAAYKKHQLAGYVSLLSPPTLLQKVMTRRANTDALAAFEYEEDIRHFHKALRHFYYPSLFSVDEFDKASLQTMPSFEQVREQQKTEQKVE
jgi:ABC-2 type transport system permease protein